MKKTFTTHFWVIRHAPTQRNKAGLIQGNQNTPDTHIIPEGAVPYLKNLNADSLPEPSVIITSPLTRTEETARALLRYRRWTVPIREERQLHEREQGVFEGKNQSEVLAILKQN